MNRLTGKITALSGRDGIVLVKILSAGGLALTSVILESPETAHFIREGITVDILFKETEVMIGKGDVSGISVRNRIPGEITSVKLGEILCQVELRTNGAVIRSIITKEAATDLRLSVGDHVIALVKSNEISLAAHD
jgi:molybdate transport system regulatory protein